MHVVHVHDFLSDCLIQEEEDQSLAPDTSNGAFQFAPAVQTVPAGGFNF